MDQFTITGNQRNVLFGFMGLGLLCMIITFFGDDMFHTRFWTNYLHNSVFFTGIALMSLFILSAFTTALAGWHTLIKRIWEAYSMFLIPGLILMAVVVIATVGHMHHLYHWTDASEVANDPILNGKSGFLNLTWFSAGTIIIPLSTTVKSGFIQPHSFLLQDSPVQR